MASLLAGIAPVAPVDLGASFDAGKTSAMDMQRQGLQLQGDKQAAALKTAEIIGRFAVDADTPEKWAAAMQTAAQMGVPDATEYASQFGKRDQIIRATQAVSDQLNTRTAGQFLGALPQSQPQGATLDGRYLASVSQPAAPATGAAPPIGQSLVGSTGGDMLNPGLAQSESGGNPAAVNRLGYSGRYQMGEGALADAGVYQDPTPGSKNDWAGTFNIPGFPQVKTQADFLANPQAQEAAYKAHADRLGTEMDAAGLGQYIGQTVGGVPITADGLIRMAHLGGVAGTKRFLQSGGKHNPADENGTSLADYGRRGAGAGGGAVRPATGDIQAPVGNTVPNEALSILAANPTYAGTAINTAIAQYGVGKNTPTDDMREYQFARAHDGFTGTFQDWLLSQKKAGASTVTVDQKGEVKYDQTMGEGLAKMNLDMAQDAQKARSSINTLQMMQGALADPNVTQGAWGPSSLMLKRGAQALGMDVGNLGPAELAQAIGSELTLQARDPSQGGGMPGAMSDADRTFLQTIPPGLSKTPQGNAMVIDYLTRRNQRTLEIEKLRQTYVRENGRMDENFFAKLSDWSDAHPLFSDADRAAMQAATPAPLPQFNPNAATAAPAGSPPIIRNDDDFNALPSGTEFIAPDGYHRKKP